MYCKIATQLSLKSFQLIKKFAVISLLLVYTLSIFGLSVRQFFCCGKLKFETLSLVVNEKHRAEPDNNCCQTNYKTFKVNDAHYASDISGDFTKHFSYSDIHFPFDDRWVVFTRQKRFIHNSNSPPGKNIPLYIFNCVYRI